MSSNVDFYKKAGFFFVGVIVVMFAAKHIVFQSGRLAEPQFQKGGQSYAYEELDKVISWRDADKYYGKIVTVEGDIVRTHNSGRAVFLNFHHNYKKYFTAIIFSSDFSKFPANPQDYYKGKAVRVRGPIKSYQDSPQIILNDPQQIEIVRN